MLLILILILAIVTPLIAKKVYKKQIHFFEFFVYAIVMIGVIFGIYKYNIYSILKDTEILNGLVRKKVAEKATCVFNDRLSRCRNGYSCKPYPCGTYKCGKSRCTKICHKRCYKYPWEKFYMVYHTLGKFEIDRVDKQGKSEPNRFTVVKIGDPVAIKNNYKNYILGAKYSLFSKELLDSEEYKIPTYPLEIYDYQYLDRVLLFGKSLPKLDYKKFNYEYSKFLGEVGKSKQLNSVLVLTDKTQKFAKVLEAKWVGGKKNDVVIVIGTNVEGKINWVHSFGWSKKNRVFVELRETLIKHGKVNLEVIEIIRKATNKYFERKEMKEFEYLKSEVKANFKILQIIFFVLLSGGFLYYLISNTVIESDTYERIFSLIGEKIVQFLEILFKILEIFFRR